MREHDIDDALLDEALSAYADPGPNSGLEARVLARLNAFRPQPQLRPRRGWLWFAIGSPAAACVLLGLLAHWGVLHGRLEPSSRTPDIARANPEAAPIRTPKERPTNQIVHMPGRHAVPHNPPRPVASGAPNPVLPKLADFPSIPSPTPEERAVLQWQKHAPESARQAFVQPLPETPHDIAAIRIAPIEMPALSSE